MTAVDAAAGPGLAPARPWPGLDAFSEELSRFFFGRDGEIDELFARVRRDAVTLLFGQSGLGKTSLLQAGLFQRLRAAGFLPILIRLDYSPGAPSPTAQVKAAIERDFAAAGVAEATPIGAEESLWGYFHRADRKLVAADGKVLVPVIVFDQFEEMFTLGLARDANRGPCQEFLGGLAELIENRPPEAVAKAIEADPEVIETYLFDRGDYRIVVALREDFLAPLESLRARAPSLGRNRFRLRRMTGRQGLEAVVKPVPGLVEPEVAEDIIRFIGRANPEDAFGAAAGAGDPAQGFEIEPSLLSLVCRELNERRIARGLDRITRDLLVGSREDIIASFYEQALADQPPALRAFIEDELLSDSGYRESITLERAHRVLAAAGVAAAALDELVRRRLLRIEERLDVPRVEIIHDVLTGVIRQSRDTRRLRQAEADAAAREAALQRERRRLRRAHWAVAAMVVLALASLGTAGLAWWAYEKSVAAERRTAAALEQTAAALQETEEQRRLTAAALASAEQQRKLAESNFGVAIDTADDLVTEVEDRLRPLVGVSTATVLSILTVADHAFERLTNAAPEHPRLRWRRAMLQVNFVEIYRALGNSDEGVRRAQLSRDLMIALVAEQPDNTDWLNDLAVARERVGDVLLDQGDLPGALAEYQAELEVFQRLTEKDPNNTAWQRNFAIAHEKVGDVLQQQSDLPGALEQYRAKLAIMEKLIARDAENVTWQRSLAIAHEKIGDVLRAQGDLDGALKEYRADLEIAERLAAKDAGSRDWQRDLSVAHEMVGDVLFSQGDLKDALDEYRADEAIARRLAAEDPGNAAWQNDLSISEEKVGDVMRAQGDKPGALKEYRACLAIRERIAPKDPANVNWQRSLAIAHEKVGDVLRDDGDLAGALKEYRADLAIAEQLAARNPRYALWQRDLSVAHERIGDVLRAQDDRAGALAEYRSTLQIRLALVELDPVSPGRQRDLAIAHEKLGDVEYDDGDIAGALKEYEADLQLSQNLVQRDPRNVDWQRGLLLARYRIGLVQVRQNKPAEAVATFEECEKLALRIQEVNPTAATSASDLAAVRRRLEEARKKLAAAAPAAEPPAPAAPPPEPAPAPAPAPAK